MEPLHARYPFLDAAREAVRGADVDLGELVRERGPVVERALERVRTAIDDGRVGPEHRSVEIELLSYPVARVLVSLVGEPGLTHRYARSEARTAHERFTADFEDDTELRSVDRDRATLDDLLRELELAGALVPTEDGFEVAVATYLELTGDRSDERWRLTRRALADGRVSTTREEGYELLREAIHGRVASGLPLSVPDEIEAELAEETANLRDRIAELDPAREFEAVEPELFPPCVTALLGRAADADADADADPLPAHSRFALAGFLASVGVDDEGIRDRFAAAGGDEAVDYQLDHLRDDAGEGAVYPPPSCAGMQAYGDCVNRDALCATIAHPLDYYRKRLDGDDRVLDDHGSRAESQ